MSSLIQRLLGIEGSAVYLSFSEWTVRDLVTRGVIPTVKVPHDQSGDRRSMRRILIDRNDLDALIEKWKDRDRVEPSTIPAVRKVGRPRGTKTKPATRG